VSKVYFFHGPQYSRYDSKTDAVDVSEASIRDEWQGLPPAGVDAAINWGNGKTYFFSAEMYYRYDNKADAVDAGYPLPIAGNWNGLTLDRVDACVNWGNGKAYFFRGSQYWRYDIATDRADAGYPQPIAGNWQGLFPSNIDGAINWGNGKAYFFRGSEYSRFDIKANAVEGGWPKPIAGNWPGLFPSSVRAPVMLGFAGLDRSQYPGDAAMQQLFNNSNLAWTGFYLAPAPSHGETSWMTHFATLQGLGWGIAPIYVGQQQPEPNSPGSHNVTAAQGTLDAANAILLAATAGIPEDSVLYLDIETGGPIQPGLAAYYTSWVAGVAGGGYRPGVYCSFLLAKQLYGLDHRPVFWTFNLNKFRSGLTAHYNDPFPAPEPVFSTVDIADAWQLAQNGVLVSSGQPNLQPMDFDSCGMRDPLQIP
jgi:hypothetical protein